MVPVWPRCPRCSLVRGRTRSRLRALLATRGSLGDGGDGPCSHPGLRQAGNRFR